MSLFGSRCKNIEGYVFIFFEVNVRTSKDMSLRQMIIKGYRLFFVVEGVVRTSKIMC